jgi:dTDP-4-amino-4,6-dideoxygalactose transaminase
MPNNDWNNPNCWLTSITLKGRLRPLEIIEALEKENIESRPIWKPMHMQPFFEKYDFIGGKVGEHIFENGLCLPSDTKMTVEEQKKVINIIRELYHV